MKCPECNVQQLQVITKPIKEGYLLKHKKRVFGKDWKKNWVILYEDSTMAWYKDKNRLETPSGTIFVKEAPEMLAVGKFTFRIPGTPLLPPSSNYYQLMALGTKNNNTVHWLLAESEDEVNEWMTAISNTLPPAPSKTPKKDDIRSFAKSSISKKCKNCCTCKYTICYLNDKNILHSKCCDSLQYMKPNKTLSDVGTGILMGHAITTGSSRWNGWGEGIGWDIAAISGPAFNTLDHTPFLQSHHFGDEVDYDGNLGAVSHEAVVIDSAGESTGFLSLDFLF